MILAGDCGGTKTNLALYRVAGGRLRLARFRSFASREYPSLSAMIGEFVAGGPRATLACVGAAGPVEGGRALLTNLPWVVGEGEIRRASGAREAFLINDLEAAACSIPFLAPRDVASIVAGRRERGGPVAVVAAGTGLGVAFLLRIDRGYLPVASEGGHVDFAPRTGREVRLLEFLRARYGRVSVERAVSGPGLQAIHRFVTEIEGTKEVPPVAALIGAGDPPVVIAREGLGRRSPACREAVRLFASLYGAAAGNIALQVKATGGVFLAGGVAPAILPVLASGPFRESFVGKGRFRDYLSGIPVRVILNARSALVGAARYALARGREGR